MLRGRRLLTVAAPMLGALVLQSSFFPLLGVGVVPDLLLVACVLVGFVRGVGAGAAAGAAAGLVEDVLAGRHLGLMLLARAAAGGAAGLVGRFFQRERALVPGVAGFLATWLQRAVMAGAVAVAGAGPAAPVWEARLGIEAAVNGALAALAYLGVMRAAARRRSSLGA